MSDPDPAAAYDTLRTETATMLRLNLADLSLVEGLQLDLVALLRLEIDSLQGAALFGEQIDLQRLAVAHGMLQKMLPEKSLVASPAAASETRFGADHKARLRRLIETTLLAPVIEDPVEIERKRDILAREEMAAAIAAGVPPPVAPPPPLRPDNVVPLDPNNRRPPDHYLADYQRQHEPWRGAAEFTVPSWPLPR